MRRYSGFVDSLQIFVDQFVLDLLFRNGPKTFELADLMGKSLKVLIVAVYGVDFGFKGCLPENESKPPANILHPVFELSRVFLSKVSGEERHSDK